jgi:hypothetical protein
VDLRGCLKSLGCRESTQHEPRHREINHCFTALGQPCIVFAPAACLIEPRPCPLYDPAAREEHQAFTPVGTHGHTQAATRLLGAPLHQLPALGPLDPEQAELFAGPTPPGTEAPGARWIGHRSGGDDHGHEHAHGIDQEGSCAACALFSPGVAPRPTQCRRLDALAVEAASRGVFVAPRWLASLGAPGVVEALPGPGIPPLAARPGHTGPLRLLLGEHAPLDAPIDDRKQGMDHRPHLQLAVAPTRLGWWDQRLDKIPVGISAVCGVWIGVHPQSVLN